MLEHKHQKLEYIQKRIEHTRLTIAGTQQIIADTQQIVVYKQQTIVYNQIIMLSFNPKNVFSMRGIEKTTAFLVRLGMDHSTASRFLKSKSQFVKIKDIEKLCIALNCTPNDLFEWKPDANTVLPESHSLNALEKREKTKNLQELVKDIPSNKLALIEQLLNELKA